MPVVSLYQHQSQLRSQSPNPRAHPHALTAKAQALGGVSAGLTQLGHALADAQDHRALTEYRLAEQDFEATEQKWRDSPEGKKAEEQDLLKRYDVNRRAFNDAQLKKKHLSPRAKEAISAATREATTRGSLTAHQHARKQSVEKALAASESAISLALTRGDLQTATAQLDADISLGLRHAATREATLATWTAKLEKDQILRQIAVDPIGALERLQKRGADKQPSEYGLLDEAQRFTLENHARERGNMLRQHTYQQLAERMQAGEVLGDKELDELVVQKLLKATDATRIKAQREAGGLSAESTQFMELFHRARVYDAARDQRQETATAIMAESLVMPDFDRRRLWAILEERGARAGTAGSAGSASRPSAATNEVHKVALGIIQNRFTSGVYGELTDEAGAENREALMHRYQVEDEVDRFMRQNPETSKVQVLRFLDEAEARTRQAGLAHDLLGPTASGGAGASPLSLRQVGVDARAIESILSKYAQGPGKQEDKK